jgi:hypothetical protein
MEVFGVVVGYRQLEMPDCYICKTFGLCKENANDSNTDQPCKNTNDNQRYTPAENDDTMFCPSALNLLTFENKVKVTAPEWQNAGKVKSCDPAKWAGEIDP